MQLMIAFAFVFLVFFFLLLFKIDSNTIKAVVESSSRKSKTFEKNFKKKKSRIAQGLTALNEMLEAMEQKHRFYGILGVTLILAVVGSSFGITTANFYLIPVFAVGFACAPFLYLRFQFVKYNRMVIEEAEVALSTISLSYERTENILQAIEENLENIHAPIQRIFQEFVSTVRYSNPNVEAAIDRMKGKINHSVWMEWCDALKRCSRDRSLKHILRPIVGKLTKIKIVTGDLQNMLYSVTRNFWTLLVLNLALLFVGVYLVPSGLQAEIPIGLANLLVAVNVAFMGAAAVKVSLNTRDIKFDI